jgi:hypothetical protein
MAQCLLVSSKAVEVLLKSVVNVDYTNKTEKKRASL